MDGAFQHWRAAWTIMLVEDLYGPGAILSAGPLFSRLHDCPFLCIASSHDLSSLGSWREMEEYLYLYTTLEEEET